ncbi:MAG: serine dehydratase subunit alpha family protein [Betaproteobacteria bacterium]
MGGGDGLAGAARTGYDGGGYLGLGQSRRLGSCAGEAVVVTAGMRLVELLTKEFTPAVGCTEPAAIALATATAYHALGGEPREITVSLSTNVLKNAWAVGIPGTSDTGIEVAALLGVVLNRPEAGLELFSLVSEKAVEQVRRLRERCPVTVTSRDSVPRVYIHARVVTDRGVAIAETRERHAWVRLLAVDGCQTNASTAEEEHGVVSPKTIGTLADVLSTVSTIPPDDLDFLLERASLNLQIARAGLATDDGVGMSVLQHDPISGAMLGQGIAARLALHAAAACDARMAGVQLPVASCGGSGNLGITASVPVLLGAEELGAPRKKTTRALAVSLVTSLYVKEFLGRLSPVCGCALGGGSGVAAGLAFLCGGDTNTMAAAVTNVVATLAGMLCDGGKVGCSLKVWSTVMTACQAALLAVKGRAVPAGNGLVGPDLETTLCNLATLSSEGMASADRVLVSVLQGRMGSDARAL